MAVLSCALVAHRLSRHNIEPFGFVDALRIGMSGVPCPVVHPLYEASDKFLRGGGTKDLHCLEPYVSCHRWNFAFSNCAVYAASIRKGRPVCSCNSTTSFATIGRPNCSASLALIVAWEHRLREERQAASWPAAEVTSGMSSESAGLSG